MKTYLVGGAVRDALLDLPVTERDWVVVGGTPEELEALGFRQVGRDFPVFLHPDTSEEYALARTERKRGRGHRGFEVMSDPSVSLEEDLSRRDLTVNAMARAEDDTLVDPYGGRRDLEARLLRHVSPAFVEDPLRVLRVARFAARFASLGFKVAPETAALMREITDSGELETLSPERVWSETERALATPTPAVYFRVLETCGAAARLLPEINDPESALARLETMAAHSEDTTLRFAALLSGLTTAAVASLCGRLNAPKRYAELAGLWVELEAALTDAISSPPEERLAVLERADAFRRPERFAVLLELLTSLHSADTAAACWLRALKACENVDAAALAAEGIPGHEIGARLRAGRLAKIGETA